MPPAALFADDPRLGQFHGDVCPAGHYCPKGSTKPSPCPPGKDKKKKKKKHKLQATLYRKKVKAQGFSLVSEKKKKSCTNF